MLEKFRKVEIAAKGSKWYRFTSSPIHYVFAIAYRQIYYRLTKKGYLATTNTFFEKKMKIVLPAAMDIYITGGKTHDSELRLTKFLIHNIQKNSIFIDIGAHFGFFTMLASSLIGENGKVFAIEASPETFKLLTQNIKNLFNVNAFNLAASDENGQVVFNEFPILYSEYNALNINAFGDAKWLKKVTPKLVEVQATSIDAFCEKQNIIPSIVKIDAEGAEYQILKGFSTILANKNTTLILEIWADECPENNHVKAINLMQTLGYQAFEINGEGVLIPCNSVFDSLKKRKEYSDNFVFR